MNQNHLERRNEPSASSAKPNSKEVNPMQHNVFEYYNEHFNRKPRLEHYTDDGWAPDSTCALINRMFDTGFLDPEETQKWLLANSDR